MMTRTQSRAFTWFDAVVLVVAAAAGIGLSRSVPAVKSITAMETIHFKSAPGRTPERTAANALYYPSEDRPGKSRHWRRVVVVWMQRAALWPAASLTAFTLAVLALTFVPPHPAGRGWLSRPGVLAGLAFLVALTGSAMLYPQTLMVWKSPATGWVPHWRDWWMVTCFSLPRAAACAVAMSWLTLGLTGRWRIGDGWLNRSGAILGACWIFLGCVSALSSWFSLFVR